jgi:hypothetical protein
LSDGVYGCRLGSAGLEKCKAITEHEALGNLPAPQNPPERVVWDGAKLVTRIDGREVYRYVPPAPTTYLAPPPLVADLSGKRRILVRDSASNYLLCSAEGKKERVFLERRGPVAGDVEPRRRGVWSGGGRLSGCVNAHQEHAESDDAECPLFHATPLAIIGTNTASGSSRRHRSAS